MSGNLGSITSAWYQREITVPVAWRGRRITLSTEYLNSFAAVYIDGKKDVTLEGTYAELAVAFQALVDNYIQKNYPRKVAEATPAGR